MPTPSAGLSCRIPLRDPSRSALWTLGALALAGASLAAVPVFKTGPPPGHTGGFGEPTCQVCHSDGGLNEPGGGLAITGAPAGYEPGRTYELEIVLRRAGMLRAGFQLAARFADGAAAGTPAGALAPGDERSMVIWDTVSHVSYIEHNLAGTALVGDAGRWTLRWTAPGNARGAVVFNAAGNAANDDDSPLGDFIYTTAVRVAPTRH
jgi:cytochrome c5